MLHPDPSAAHGTGGTDAKVAESKENHTTEGAAGAEGGRTTEGAAGAARLNVTNDRSVLIGDTELTHEREKAGHEAFPVSIVAMPVTALEEEHIVGTPLGIILSMYTSSWERQCRLLDGVILVRPKEAGGLPADATSAIDVQSNTDTAKTNGVEIAAGTEPTPQ